MLIVSLFVSKKNVKTAELIGHKFFMTTYVYVIQSQCVTKDDEFYREQNLDST